MTSRAAARSMLPGRGPHGMVGRLTVGSTLVSTTTARKAGPSDYSAGSATRGSTRVPEELERPQERAVRHEAVVRPCEEPVHGKPADQPLELPRDGVGRAHEGETLREEVGSLAGFRIGKSSGEAERLEPSRAAEGTAVPPQG